MIQEILIWGLLSVATAQYSQGLSGSAEIDFGRVIPGHAYYYRSYFVNRTQAPLKLSHSSMRCQTCPQLIKQQSWLAPGDSTELFFLKQFGAAIKDSVSSHIYVYTDDGRQRGMWIYNLKLKAVGRCPVKPMTAPVKIALNSGGVFEGRFDLLSRSQDTLWVIPRGLPPGFRFSPEMPARILPERSLRITFTAPPEVINDHRSLTLELVGSSEKGGFRMSLPMEYR